MKVKLNYIFYLCFLLGFISCNRNDSGDVGAVEETITACNQRYGFCIKVPADWQINEKSKNNDGFVFELPDSSIDAKIFGRPKALSEERDYDYIFKDTLDTSSFTFEDGVEGYFIERKNNFQFVKDYEMYFVIFSISAETKWLKKNRPKLAEIAKSVKENMQADGG